MKRLSLETRVFQDKEGYIRKGIFVDGEYFDWGVDEENFKDAMSMGPAYVEVIKRDIERHFIESFSEFIGKKITIEEFQIAMKNGYLEK